MSTNQSIKNFLLQIANKNYSQANAALHKMVENKLKNRVRVSLDQKNTAGSDK
jgi:hypothetical protein